MNSLRAAPWAHPLPAVATAILNLGSGAQRQQHIAEQLHSIFRGYGGELRIGYARRGRDIYSFARAAVAEGVPVVLAGGGDGTISAVASVVAGSQSALGVLPLGTFNYFARLHGIPLDPEAAARLCFEGEVHPVSLGEVNGRVFLNNASFGLYSRLLQVREDSYRRWGRSQVMAYFSALRSLLRRHPHHEVTITAGDRTEHCHTTLVFAVHNPYQVESFGLEGGECVRQGRLAFYVVPPLTRSGLLRLGCRAMTRRLSPAVDFQLICADSMRIATRRSEVKIAYDGEIERMRPPLVFRAHQNALRLLVPGRPEAA